jgi:hypothetical protein
MSCLVTKYLRKSIRHSTNFAHLGGYSCRGGFRENIVGLSLHFNHFSAHLFFLIYGAVAVDSYVILYLKQNPGISPIP